MNSRSFVAVGLVLLGLSSQLACSKKFSFGSPNGSSDTFSVQTQKGEPLAKIGSATISVEGLAELVGRQGPFLRQHLVGNTDRQKDFLDGQVKQQLLVQEALKRGYLSNDPSVREGIERLLAQKVSRDYFTNQATVTVPDQEIKDYYTAHNEEFNRPEKFRVEYAFVPFAANKALSLKQAHEFAKKAHQVLAKKAALKLKDILDDMNAASKGAASPVAVDTSSFLSSAEAKDKFGDKSEAAIWALKQDGGMTQVVEGKDGYYFFRRMSYKEPAVRDLEAAKPVIEKRLAHQKQSDNFNKFVDDLKKQTKVEIFQDQLKKFEAALNAVPADAPNKLPGATH